MILLSCKLETVLLAYQKPSGKRPSSLKWQGCHLCQITEPQYQKKLQACSLIQRRQWEGAWKNKRKRKAAMSYKQLEALSSICVWQRQLVKASLVLCSSGKERKVSLPHLSKSHNRGIMTKGCPAFLLPNSYEQYGERGSKFVRDDTYPTWITLAQGQKGDGQMVLPEITTHSPPSMNVLLSRLSPQTEVIPVTSIIQNFKIFFSFLINKSSLIICQFWDILFSNTFLGMHFPWK